MRGSYVPWISARTRPHANPQGGRNGAGSSVAAPTEPPAPAPEPMDTADMTPASKWAGTYLDWLPNDLLNRILGSLQLLMAMDTSQFRIEVRDRGPGADGKNFSVKADHPNKLDHYYNRYHTPIKSKPSKRALFNINSFMTVQLPAFVSGHIAKHRANPNVKRRKRLKRFKREAIRNVLWFSDVLLHTQSLHSPFRLKLDCSIDYSQVPNSCGGGYHEYDWEDRSKWPSAAANTWERLGFSFELPQQRFLGSYGQETLYDNHMRELYKAEGRAATTDMLDMRGGSKLEPLGYRRFVEWGLTFEQSNYARALRGEPIATDQERRDQGDAARKRARELRAARAASASGQQQ